MTGYAMLAALAFLYVSDSLHRSVVKRARPLMPDSLQEERKASYALGVFIWDQSFPDDLRRKYLWSVTFGAMAAFCVTLVAYNTRHPNWAVFFAGVLLFVTWHGLSGWAKYRQRP
ncbi:MAG: hypothetical protein ACREB8_09130 [Pseudolabrys sp.]